MRTTLTVDKDVAARLAEEADRTGTSLETLINRVLRRGLGMTGEPPRRPRFEVQPHSFGVRPGFDLDRMNQVSD